MCGGVPRHGERLVIQVLQKDLPKALRNARIEQVLAALEPHNLVGDGPLRRGAQHNLGLLSTCRQAPWVKIAAWSFNLAALLFGCFIFLFSLHIVFQAPGADASFIGAFVSACLMGILLTVICTEGLTAALVAALPYSSRRTYMPARFLCMAIVMTASVSGWTRLGIDVTR